VTIETAVITGTTPTSTGTKSFESSGFGTPQAAIIMISAANGTNNPESGALIGVGFTDGTRDGYVTAGCDDNVSTSNTARGLNTTAVLALVNGDQTALVAADFSAWATNGITLNFSTVDSVAYNISITLIKGCTNVYAGSAQLTTTGVNNITTPNFSGNLVYAATVGYNTLGLSTNAIKTFGAAHNSSTDTVTQGCISLSSVDNQADETASVVSRDDCGIGQLHSGTQNWKGSFEDFDATGFSINTGSDSPGSDYIVYLFLDTGDEDGVDISIVSAPTSTGTWNVTDPGWEPQSVILGMTSNRSLNIPKPTDPIFYGMAMFDGTTEACLAVDFDDAAATTDNQSNFSSSNGVELYSWGGSSHDLLYQGSFTAFDSLGYDFSFPTYIDATGTHWLSIAIKTAAAGGTTVSATTAAITTATFQSGVNAKKAITSTTAAISLATYQATITQGADTNINATTAAITATAYQASVNAKKTITSTTAAISLATYQATIVTGLNISATTAAITTATYAATITDIVNWNISATTANISLTPYQATVTAGVSVWTEQTKDATAWTELTADTTNWTEQ